MRYKDNALNRLTQLEATANRLQLQINRSMSQDDMLNSIEQLKEGIEGMREMISVEPDDFDQQFRPQ
jgi:hypothetical protein